VVERSKNAAGLTTAIFWMPRTALRVSPKPPATPTRAQSGGSLVAPLSPFLRRPVQRSHSSQRADEPGQRQHLRGAGEPHGGEEGDAHGLVSTYALFVSMIQIIFTE